jgi:hypothetical protein
MDLRNKGYTDGIIAEKFGMGHTALHRRKKQWGLVGSRPGKTSSPISISERDIVVQEDDSNSAEQIQKLNYRISNLEAENKLLWDMVHLLKRTV